MNMNERKRIIVVGQPDLTQVDNSVHTTKYTRWTFGPKVFLAQFKRIANLWFLIIGLLMLVAFVTGSSFFATPVPPWPTLVPLMIVIMMSMGQERIAEAQRRNGDLRLNHTEVTVLEVVSLPNTNNTNNSNSNNRDDEDGTTGNRLLSGRSTSSRSNMFRKISARSHMNTTTGDAAQEQLLEDEHMMIHEHDRILDIPAFGNTTQAEGEGTSTRRSGLVIDEHEHDAAGAAQARVRLRTVHLHEIRVGQLVLLRNRDMIPADLILLATSNERGGGYVETSSIDGETNLKARASAKMTIMDEAHADTAAATSWRPAAAAANTTGTANNKDTATAATTLTRTTISGRDLSDIDEEQQHVIPPTTTAIPSQPSPPPLQHQETMPQAIARLLTLTKMGNPTGRNILDIEAEQQAKQQQQHDGLSSSHRSSIADSIRMMGSLRRRVSQRAISFILNNPNANEEGDSSRNTHNAVGVASVTCETPNASVHTFVGKLSYPSHARQRQQQDNHQNTNQNNNTININHQAAGENKANTNTNDNDNDNTCDLVESSSSPPPPPDTVCVSHVPLSADNLLLRGASLRNTEWAIGMACFTGEDTKLVQNSSETPPKFSILEQMVNKIILYLIAFILVFIFVIVLAGRNALPPADHVWYLGLENVSEGEDPTSNKPWPYLASLPPPQWDEWGSIPLYKTYLTYVALMSQFIPLSMYISFEIMIRVFMIFINNDVDMYYDNSTSGNTNDAASDAGTPAFAKNTNVTDLGQIDYIFSDKTGTLTQNIMNFRRCSINGKIYGEPLDKNTKASPSRSPDVYVGVIGAAEEKVNNMDMDIEQNTRREDEDEDDTHRKNANTNTHSNFLPLEHILERGRDNKSQSQRQCRKDGGGAPPAFAMTFNSEMFLRVMAICHTVVVEKDYEGDTNDNNNDDDAEERPVRKRDMVKKACCSRPSSWFQSRKRNKSRAKNALEEEEEFENKNEHKNVAPLPLSDKDELHNSMEKCNNSDAVGSTSTNANGTSTSTSAVASAPTSTAHDNDNGNGKGPDGAPIGFNYQAESPDESALVSAASNLFGYQFSGRDSESVTVRTVRNNVMSFSVSQCQSVLLIYSAVLYVYTQPTNHPTNHCATITDDVDAMI
jgi:magnesium-transporting ATPase (P-type)